VIDRPIGVLDRRAKSDGYDGEGAESVVDDVNTPNTCWENA